MRKYLVWIDLVLLALAAGLLLIDIQIKNDLVKAAKEFEAKLDEQRGTKGSYPIHPVVPGDISGSDVLLGETVEAPSHSPNGSNSARPRKRNSTAANGNAGNPGEGISGSSD